MSKNWRRIDPFEAFDNMYSFSVNTLLPRQEHIPNLFGDAIEMSMDERFYQHEWKKGLTGVPVLTNASVSSECELSNAAEIRTEIKAWKDDYNKNRPHSSLGNATPNEFAIKMALEKRAA